MKIKSALRKIVTFSRYRILGNFLRPTRKPESSVSAILNFFFWEIWFFFYFPSIKGPDSPVRSKLRMRFFSKFLSKTFLHLFWDGIKQVPHKICKLKSYLWIYWLRCQVYYTAERIRSQRKCERIFRLAAALPNIVLRKMYLSRNRDMLAPQTTHTYTV